MKILTVIGARPQFIKAATVSRALREKNIKEIIVHTGQHFDLNMSEIFFTEMDIPKPDYFLNVNGLSHGAMTGQMIEKIETVLKNELPSMVLVYGDTNSTLAGTLAAVKLHIPVAHVEAGLRSFNMKMPEEINRIVTDRLSARLYCPTQTAVNNLENEGFNSFQVSIVQSGDVMYDAALYYAIKTPNGKFLDKYRVRSGEYFLSTIHREENTNNINNLRKIVTALNALHQQQPVVVPLHPRTKKIISAEHINVDFKIIDPVGYFEMLDLTRNAKCILTDSGGLQKEAYFFQKFCVTMRDQTEWVELAQAGVNKLTGADDEKILAAVKSFETRNFIENGSLYGDGKAAYKIVNDLLH